ncbi:MAG: sigma-70 family RNA polymerase sigma factor [Actinomycetota bacterium]|nr:sigma-70 family RNA polymerase sigma factor [Actinomycetota bacterium]
MGGELIDERSAEAAEPSGSDLDKLFRTEGDGVYRTLYAFTGGRADVAEEATAEAFARAVAKRDVLRDPLAWIYRVAFRVAIDELRADRRRGQEVDVALPAPELAGLTDALRQLSPNQRAAIVLRHVMDLDPEEIAHRMGIAQPTVRVHLHRARKRLRELLGVEEVD